MNKDRAAGLDYERLMGV